jgi:hypothetical protein
LAARNETIFPDFSVDLMSIGDMGGELIALELVAHGTNTDDEQSLRLQLAP